MNVRHVYGPLSLSEKDVIVHCPYCGHYHFHGCIQDSQGRPAIYQGTRSSYCSRGSGGSYDIYVSGNATRQSLRHMEEHNRRLRKLEYRLKQAGGRVI
jgi:hypothetical protein